MEQYLTVRVIFSGESSMASLRLIREISPAYHVGVADNVSQLEIPDAGLLLTFEGKPLALVMPPGGDPDGSLSLLLALPLSAKVLYDAELREHGELAIDYPPGTLPP